MISQNVTCPDMLKIVQHVQRDIDLCTDQWTSIEVETSNVSTSMEPVLFSGVGCETSLAPPCAPQIYIYMSGFV